MKLAAPSIGLMSRTAAPSIRDDGAGDPLIRAVVALEEEWQRGGVPSLERHWFDHGRDDSLTGLAALVKADLRCRYVRGECPAVADYLERFPGLRAVHDRVVSLVYEEFCLREEHGEPLDPERFCDRYEPWRDSLESQLRYHRLLSQVVAPPTAPPRFPEPGEEFQGFELRSVLGRGGVARVYLAYEKNIGHREVALKVSPDKGEEPSIQGRLDHAHIVPVLSVTSDPETGLRGLCMPYRSGSSLDEVIRWVEPGGRPRRAKVLWDALASKGRSEWEKGPTEAGWQGFPVRGTYAEGVAWVVLTLAKALQHAHSRDILHRDVKPANVLLTLRDGPQLLDFNLAHDPHNAQSAEAALRGGTLPYMAPEQLEAFLDPARWADVGKSADLYGLGLLLRELLTGQRPEPPDPAIPLPRAIRELLDRRAQPQPPLRSLILTIPPALDAIAARCLAFSPSCRYAEACELVVDLERFLDHRPLRYAANPSRRELAGNWARRNRVALLVVALALVGIPLVVSNLTEGPADAKKHVAMGNFYNGGHKFKQAREEYERAIRLDPDYFPAYQGLVVIDFEDVEKRYHYSTRAIEAARRWGPVVEPEVLAELFQTRAAASTERGNRLQRSGKLEGFLAASPHYEEAMEDLEEAKRRDRGGRKGLPFNIAYGIAWAEVGRGDVSSRFDEYEGSVAHYLRAQEHIERALALEPRNKWAEKLEQEVNLRLKVDRPKLKLTQLTP
jgi:serine/threonine protein kinase